MTTARTPVARVVGSPAGAPTTATRQPRADGEASRAGTLSTTATGSAFASGSPEIEVDDVLFRMLKPPEIGRAIGIR